MPHAACHWLIKMPACANLVFKAFREINYDAIMIIQNYLISRTEMSGIVPSFDV